MDVVVSETGERHYIASAVKMLAMAASRREERAHRRTC
jgi:hypothetical protein